MPKRISSATSLRSGSAVIASQTRTEPSAAIDNLQFKAGAYVNDTLVLIGRVTHVGHTSMEVRVDTYVESLNGTRSVVNSAYLVLVALDEQGHPTPVPGLLLETESERAEWEAGERRQELRKTRRQEGY